MGSYLERGGCRGSRGCGTRIKRQVPPQSSPCHHALHACPLPAPCSHCGLYLWRIGQWRLQEQRRAGVGKDLGRRAALALPAAGANFPGAGTGAASCGCGKRVFHASWTYRGRSGRRPGGYVVVMHNSPAGTCRSSSSSRLAHPACTPHHSSHPTPLLPHMHCSGGCRRWRLPLVAQAPDSSRTGSTGHRRSAQQACEQWCCSRLQRRPGGTNVCRRAGPDASEGSSGRRGQLWNWCQRRNPCSLEVSGPLIYLQPPAGLRQHVHVPCLPDLCRLAPH